MSHWEFPLPDYWDQTTSAINRNVLQLIRLSETERLTACSRIEDAVQKRLAALTDGLLLQAAVSMVDDLYKYVNDTVLMDGALFSYLDAFARTLTSTVSERGYVIHYVVENSFSAVDFLMRGPFDLFPAVFQAAGLVYVCPHQLALRLMQADGVAALDYSSAIARYIDEGRALADRLVNQCAETGRHYLFLEVDYREGALDLALQGSDVRGLLTIFRNDAPVAGSTVSVRFPDQTREC